MRVLNDWNVTNLLGKNSQIVKLVRALSSRQGREKHGCFLVEGIKSVKELMDSRPDLLLHLLVDAEALKTEGVEGLLQRSHQVSIEPHCLETTLFRSICETKTPQGLLAVVRNHDVGLQELLENGCQLLVVADALQDPGNMGTLIRLADAVGATALIATSGTVDMFNPKVVRSAMGSMFHLQLVQNVDTKYLIKKLAERNVSVVAADPYAEKAHFDYTFTPPLAVVFGNEGRGLSSEWRSTSTLVQIPMPGRAESLNVGVAAGVLLYEVVRQWHYSLLVDNG